MAEESSLYGLENDAQEERSYFQREERMQIMDGACGRNCYFFFYCGYGSGWYLGFLLYGWSVLRKMWAYGAAGGGITILGTVLLHMMRGKVRVCFLENMEESR